MKKENFGHSIQQTKILRSECILLRLEKFLFRPTFNHSSLLEAAEAKDEYSAGSFSSLL